MMRITHSPVTTPPTFYPFYKSWKCFYMKFLEYWSIHEFVIIDALEICHLPTLAPPPLLHGCDIRRHGIFVGNVIIRWMVVKYIRVHVRLAHFTHQNRPYFHDHVRSMSFFTLTMRCEPTNGEMAFDAITKTQFERTEACVWWSDRLFINYIGPSCAPEFTAGMLRPFNSWKFIWIATRNTCAIGRCDIEQYHIIITTFGHLNFHQHIFV